MPANIYELPIEVLTKIIRGIVPDDSHIYQSQRDLPFHPKLFFVNRRFREVASEQFYSSLLMKDSEQVRRFLSVVGGDERIGSYIRSVDLQFLREPKNPILEESFSTTLQNFMEACPLITDFRISFSYQFGDALIKYCLESCINLTTRKRLQTFGILFSGVEAAPFLALSSWPNLRKLDLQLVHMTKELIVQLFQYCPRLNELVYNISSTDAINDDVLDTLTDLCPQLHTLELKGHFYDISQDCLLRFIRKLGIQLKCLEISSRLPLPVDSKVIQTMRLYAPNIQRMVFSDCGGINLDSFDEMVELLRQCRKLSYIFLHGCSNSFQKFIDEIYAHRVRGVTVLEKQGNNGSNTDDGHYTMKLAIEFDEGIWDSGRVLNLDILCGNV